MKGSPRTLRKLFLPVLVTALFGCGIHVVVPPVSSVKEIKHRTLARIDKIEKAIAEKKLGGEDIKQLAVSINYLKGHMKSVQVGTDEQQRALEEILYRLAQTAGRAMRPPQHWRPGEGTPPPPPIIEAGPISELLPQIRKIVESVPDSDLRPNLKPPGQAAPSS